VTLVYRDDGTIAFIAASEPASVVRVREHELLLTAPDAEEAVREDCLNAAALPAILEAHRPLGKPRRERKAKHEPKSESRPTVSLIDLGVKSHTLRRFAEACYEEGRVPVATLERVLQNWLYNRKRRVGTNERRDEDA